MPTSKEATIFVVISLLVIVLVFSSTADVLAKPKKTSYTCRFGGPGKVQCCGDVPSPRYSGQTITYCTICDNTSPPSNCSDRYCVSGCAFANVLSPSDNNTGQLPPAHTLSSSPPALSNALPPSSQQQQQITTTCPDGSQPDTNGNCPSGTTTTNNQQLAPPPTKSTEQHHNKASNLLGGGQELTAKKGSNNKDSSPTPPPCPTDNSPIPPNCTLKPKF